MASPEDNPRPSLEADSESTEIVARALPPSPPPRRDEDDAIAPRGHGKQKRPVTRPGKSRAGLRSLRRIAAAAAVCFALPALLAFREKVVATLPGTVSFYRSVGLPVNLVGLRFANVRSTLSQEGETPVLEVTGEIVNEGRGARTVPWLQISLEGERGDRLYSWSTKAAEGQLQVGQSAPFRVRLTAPPPDSRRVEVTFREDRGRRRTAASE